MRFSHMARTSSQALSALVASVFLTATLLLVGSPSIAVGAAASSANPQTELEAVIDTMIQSMIKDRVKIVAEPEYGVSIFENTLGKRIDFKVISKRVMGRNFKAATPAQRERFAATFESELKQLIVTAFTAMGNVSEEEFQAASSAFKLVYLPFQGIETKTLKSGRVLERCKVDIEVRTEGGVIPLQVAMYKSADGWKAENLILAGVNMGLTLRNQFAESLRSNSGNIDKTITAWNFNSTSQGLSAQGVDTGIGSN